MRPIWQRSPAMQNDPGHALKSNETRVLLLPPTRRDAEAIETLLGRANVDCIVCPTMTLLCAALEEGAGAIVISEEALTVDARGLAECISHQPVWSDLPLVVLSRSGIESPLLA